MKKVLSFVLVIALVLGSFSMAFAADTKATVTDVDGLTCEDAVGVLINLGVVNGYPDGTYKPAEIVTRAEAAKLIITALGLDNLSSGSYSGKFTDVATDHWAAGFINYAASLGIINGYPDGTFGPSKTVTYDEFITMAVRALGYRDAALTGTWPGNYVDKGRGLGILEDIVAAGNSGANRGDVAVMLYQTLDQEIGTIDNDGNFNGIRIGTKKVDGETVNLYDTMLNRLGATYNPGKIILASDGEEALINLRPYIGSLTSYYTNKDDEIIAIDETKTTFLVGTFDAEDQKFEADGVEYNYKSAKLTSDPEESDDSKLLVVPFINSEEDTAMTTDEIQDILDSKTEAELKTALDSIFGGATDPLLADSLIGEISTGDIKVTLGVEYSGKTIKYIHSLSVWDITEHDKFASEDATEIADDQELYGLEFPLDDNDDIDMYAFELIGATSLEDISEDNVVYVYANSSDEITRVAVGTETVEGTVKTIKTSSVKIDETTYDLAYVFGDATTDTLDLTDSGKAYLDANGDVYDWEISDGSSGNYGLITGAEEFGSIGTARLQLVTKDGKEAIYVVAKKLTYVSLGGASVKDEAARLLFNTKFFSGGDSILDGTVIEFGMNTSGEITKIDFSGVKEQAFAIGDYTNKTGKSFTIDGIGSIIVESNVVVFAKKTSDDSYSALGLDSIKDTTFKAPGLVFTNTDGKIVAAVTSSKDAGAGSESYALVHGVTNTVNEDNDRVQEVTTYIGGTKKTYLTNDSDMFSTTATTHQNKIYEIQIDASGVITDAVEVEAYNATTNPDGYVELKANATAKVSDYVFKDSADNNVFLDSSVTYYTFNSDSEWAKKAAKDIPDQNLILFNTDPDNLGGYDIVIIK